MGRRSSGEGTVYESANGRWVAMMELPRHPDGRRNRKFRRAATEADAKRELKKMQNEYEANGFVSPKKRLVSETVADYLKVRLASERSKSTFARDHRFAQALKKYFSARRTSELSVQDCDKFLAVMAEGSGPGAATRTSRDELRRMRSFLSRALKNDMRLGYVNRNVADIAELPTATSPGRDRRALSNSEWRTLFDVAKGPTKLAVDLGGRHGLRPQEIRSIRWSEIDLDKQTLTVVTQFDSQNNFTKPKTSRSARTIKLHDETIALLGQRRQAQLKDRRKNAAVWVDRDLVVSTRRGTAINKDNQRRSIRRLCERVEIDPIVPYELRHTAITHQIKAGCTASQVADWAGTSEKMIYEHYRHLLREVNELSPVEHEED